MWIALVLGAFVLGYLLAEWYFDGLLRRVDKQLASDAYQIEDLVSNNNALSDKNERLQLRITQLESLLQLRPESSDPFEHIAQSFKQSH